MTTRIAGARRATRNLLGAMLLAMSVVTTPAEAVEVNGGFGVGALAIGSVPRLSLSPHVGLLLKSDSGCLLALSDTVQVLPTRSGAGIVNQTVLGGGYGTENVTFTVGAAVAIYSMYLCESEYCGRVVGVAPGASARVDAYFIGPLGISVSVNVSWFGGSSPVLPGSLVAMAAAGPVVRY